MAHPAGRGFSTMSVMRKISWFDLLTGDHSEPRDRLSFNFLECQHGRSLEALVDFDHLSEAGDSAVYDVIAEQYGEWLTGDEPLTDENCVSKSQAVPFV